MSISLGSIMATMSLNIDDFSTNLSLAEEQISQTESKLDGFTKIGGRIKDIGSSLTAGVTLPLVGVGVASLKFFTDFEDGMAKVQTVADTTKMPISQIGAEVKKLSDDSGLATSDLQAGLYDVLSAGVKTEDSMAYLTVAVKAAKGGFTDTATAVDGLTSTLNAYGLEASKANEIANQMMVAQNLGKTTFGELSSVIGNVAPTANALNVSTKELFSSLAVLTANGIKTSEATTGLKATFSGMIKPTKEATDAAKAMGLEFDANTVKSKGFMPFLLDIKKKVADVAPAYGKMAEAQANVTIKMTALEKAGKKGSDEYKKLSLTHKQNALDLKALEGASKGPLSGLATMFGSVEALNSVLTLTSAQGVALYGDSMKQMGDGTDRVDSSFNTMSDTAGNKFAKSLNVLKNASLAIGAALAPAMEKVANVFSKVAKSLSDMSPKQTDMAVKFLLVVSAVGPLLVVFGTLMGSVTKIAGAFKMMKTGIDAVRNSTKLASIASSAWGVVMKIVNTISMAGPWGWLALAIVGVIIAFKLLWTHCEGFRNFWKGLWVQIKQLTKVGVDAVVLFFTVTLPGAWTKLQAFFKGIPAWFKGLWISVKAGIVTSWNGIGTFFTNIWNGIKTATLKVWTGIVTSIKSVMLQLKIAVEVAWNAVVKGVMVILAPFIKGVLNIFDGMKSGLSMIFEGFKLYFTAVWTVIKNIFLGAILLILDIVTGNFGKIKSDATGIMNNLKNAFSQIWTGIKLIFTGVITAIVGFLKVEWTGIVNISKAIWNGFKDFMSALWNGIKATAIAVWNALKAGVTALINGTISGAKSAWTGLGTFMTGLWNGIKTTAINAWNGLKTTVINTGNSIITGTKDIWNGLMKWFSELPGKLLTIGKNMFTSMKSGVDTTVPVVKTSVVNGITTALDWLKELPGKALSMGKDFIMGLVNGITGMVGKAVDAVKGVANSITDKLREVLDIHSPSKVTTVIGEQTGAGLVKGLTSSKSVIKKVTEDIATIIKQGYAKSIITLDSQVSALSKPTKVLEKDLANLKQAMVLQKKEISLLEQEYQKLIKAKGANNSVTLSVLKQLNTEKAQLATLSKAYTDTTDKIKLALEEKKKVEIDSVNKINEKVISALKKRYEQEEKLQEKTINNQLDELEKWKDKNIKDIESVYNAKTKLLDDETRNVVNALQGQIDAIDKAEQDKEDAKTNSEELDKISILRSQMIAETDATKQLDIQKQLDDALQSRQERLDKVEINAKKESIKQTIENVKTNAENRKEQMQNEEDAQKLSITNQYAMWKANLDQELIDNSIFYATKLEQANLSAEAEKLIMQNNQTEIVSLLNSFGAQYEEAGVSLGDRLVSGIKPKIDSIKAMLASMAEAVGSASQNALAVKSSAPKVSIPKFSVGTDSLPYDMLIQAHKGEKIIPAEMNPSNPYANPYKAPEPNKGLSQTLNIYSPKALSPSETARQTKRALQEFALNF